MTKTAYRLHRAVPWVFLPLLVFAAANYYLELGYLEPRTAKGMLILLMLFILVYVTFLVPSESEMEEHRDSKKGG